MPNIKVLVESFAGEDIISQVEAMAAEKSGGFSPRAYPVRDANGKVIAVNVGLPEGISQANLNNAKNHINTNNGVSSAGFFPVKIADYNFDGLTPNVLVPTPQVYEGFPMNVRTQSPSSNLWEGATAAEAKGGSGSAVRLSDKRLTGISTGGRWLHHISGFLEWDSSQLVDIASIGAFSIEWDVKNNATINGVAGFLGDDSVSRHCSAYLGYGNGAMMRVNEDTEKWAMELGAFMGPSPNNPSEDTSVGAYDWLHVKVSLDQNGLATMVAGGVTQTYDFGYVIPMPRQILSFGHDSYHSTADEFLQQPIIADNVKFTVITES